MSMESQQIKPFKVHIPDVALDDLKARLSLARFPDELDDAGWAYGAPLSDVKRLAEHWQEKYDWREAEREMNKLPMFTTLIAVDGFDELAIHFVHKRSAVSGAIPLLFVHGWPGSFLEVSKILHPLTSPQNHSSPAFHIVAPSLPNFGFSQGVKQKGFKPAQYAEICDKLMRVLGYDQYVSQGGDWGSWITRCMALQFGGKSLRAFHTNFARGHAPSRLFQPYLCWAPYSVEEKAGLKRTHEWLTKGQGYAQIQSTKPQTLGYGLSDSPVGLLAWIYEKLIDWSDPDSYHWSDDEILTWVSVYWHSTAGPMASTRIYYEAVQSGSRDDFDVPKNVPMGMSWFAREIHQPPSSHVRAAARVVYESRHDKGGHFAAHEQPEALVSDLREMFGRGGPAFGVVKGASGYSSRAKL